MKDKSQFEHDLKQQLQRSSELDAATARRLQTARSKALENRPQRQFVPWAGGLALASVTALAVGLWWQQPQDLLADSSDFEDLELLASTEDMSLYEDLDFYLWLAEQEETSI